MTTEQQQLVELFKTLLESLGTALQLRRDLDHALYLLRFAHERLAHSVASATVNAEAVEQISKFLKQHNR